MPAAVHPIRFILAIFAALLSIVALTVELTTRICTSFAFDPLPDPFAIAAYSAIPVTLLFNCWILRQGNKCDPARLRLLHIAAFSATVTAITIAALYTVMFLLLAPISIIAMVMYGIGLCAWSPLLNLIALALQLPALRTRRQEAQIVLPRPWKRGTALASVLIAAILAGVPFLEGQAASQAMNDPANRNAAVERLRFLHAEDMLRINAEVRYPNFWFTAGGAYPLWLGLTSTWASPSPGAISSEAVYYLVTGHAASAAPLPQSHRTLVGDSAEEEWAEGVAREEVGGKQVGSPIRDLRLTASDLTGAIDPIRETEHCAWTLEFRNDSEGEQEARADILLPEGGVIDQASLWIGGVERPAAFGPTETTRQAYQKIAVAQRRDPLLVTSLAPNRVLAQCFPIPAHESMKIRLGMTAPLRWGNPAAPALSFTPPILRNVNFRIGKSLHQSMILTGHWPAGRGHLQGDPVWRIEERGEDHSAQLALDASETPNPPALVVTGGPIPQIGDRIGGDRVRQTAPFAPPTHPIDLVVLIDPTARVGAAFDSGQQQSLCSALSALPAGSHYLLADSRRPQTSSTGWISSATPIAANNPWWGGRNYSGGLDSVSALQWACNAARATAPHSSAVLWLHDAKPDSICNAEALTKATGSSIHHTTLVGVVCGFGEDAVMDAIANDRGVYALSCNTPNVMQDAVRLATQAEPPPTETSAIPLGGRSPAINGLYLLPASPPEDSIAVASRTLAFWYGAMPGALERKSATKLAIASRIVSPFSGAVVLENKAQYQASDLKAPPVTETPEPSGLMALLLGLFIVIWKILGRRSTQRR